MSTGGQGTSKQGQGASKQTKKGGHGVDPCWEYGEEAIAGSTSKVKCKFCTAIFNGGITRFKDHLACKPGNVRACPNVPADVKNKVVELMKKADKLKEQKASGVQNLMNDVCIDEEEFTDNASVTGGDSSCRSNSMSLQKKFGPMDKYANRTPEDMAEGLAKTKQTTIDSHHKKAQRENTIRYIARWLFEAGIFFNTGQLESFQQMLHAIGLYGPYLEAAPPYELRNRALQKRWKRPKKTSRKLKKLAVFLDVLL